MKPISKEQVARYIAQNKHVFRERFGVNKIGLFGSIVRGDMSGSSDIDIVIEMDPDKKNLHSFLSFKRQLEKEFGRKVDLGIESTLKRGIRETVGKEIYYV